MSLECLTPSEKQIVFECLVAAADGPFFPDWEFPILFGLERDEVRQIITRWPNINESSEETRVAIHNSMGNLLGYPHHQEAVWSRFISAPENEVGRILDKWSGRADRAPSDRK
jgi:hypothetical protein